MSTVIIVDSACNMPDKLLQSNSIRVLPINIKLGGELIRDTYSSSDVEKLLEDGKISKKVPAVSDAATEEQITQFLIEEIIPNFDWAIVETISGNQSEMFDRWHAVSRALSPHYKKYRPADAKPFQLSLVDSRTSHCGQGMLALETVRLAQEGSRTRRELIHKIKDCIPYIQSYSAAPDLAYLRERAIQRGDNSVNYLNAMIGTMFRMVPIIYGMRGEIGYSIADRGLDKMVNILFGHFREAIEKDLLCSPLINISYLGDIEELNEFQGFIDLKAAAKEHGVKIFTSRANLTTALFVGPSSINVSGAIKDENFVIDQTYLKKSK